MTERHEDWFLHAQEDLTMARLGLEEGIHTQACFHAQQAIEKILKGCLVAQKKGYPKTHDLIDLVRRLPELSLEKWERQLGLIADYYAPTRYPDAAPGMKPSGPPSKEEAEEALQTAEEIFQKVREFLRSEGRGYTAPTRR